MDRSRIEPLFAAALVAGASYYANYWLEAGGIAAIVWKGAGVGLLAFWARGKAVNQDGRMIGAVLALGALGDVLLELHGLTTGAVAFMAGHLLASYLYLRHPRIPAANWIAPPVAAAVAVFAWYVFGTLPNPELLAVYVFGLALMTASAMLSRLGPLAGSPIPQLLVWPTYFVGQALIAWGAVHALRGEKAAA